VLPDGASGEPKIMADLFESSRFKIGRAKEHIEDLERQITAFVDEHPWEYTLETDPHTVEYVVHKIRLTKRLPHSIGDLIGDAAGKLRAALDHATCAIAEASAGRPVKDNAYFPFSRLASDFDRNLRGRSKNVPQEFYPLFRDLKPWAGGNDRLWGLNEICNGDKHRIITPVGLGTNDIIYRLGNDFFAMPQDPAWDRAEQKIVFTTIPSDSNSEHKFDFTLFVAFCDIAVFDGEPVVPVLHKMASHVTGILHLI